ncbi:MAG: hypothetical protein Q7T63_11075 [Burkholderiaceae bacterium]|nr:hypothetical protein [Burkholderiaceae bacterium]MDO9089728.1 hypothetical protein [Burkholderiaceae bacterium]
MNRCNSRVARATLAAALLLPLTLTLLSPAAQAQGVRREFPSAAQRAELVVTAPPEVRLNGRPERLSPGARIHGPNNLLVLSGAIVGQPYVVNYLRDSAGLISRVWILTPDEAAQKRTGSTAGTGEAIRNFLFGSESPPPKDGIAPVERPFVPK